MGLREIASRWALLRMAVGGRFNFKEMTPVGVFAFASAFSSLTSCCVQGSPERCLYFGFALRGPFFPMGDPGRFHAAFAIWPPEI
jgi:hypothetical protein